MITANILANCVAQFKAFVEKQNARAAKLGCEPIAVEYSNDFVKSVKQEDGTRVDRLFVAVAVNESVIKLNDWKVFGRIDDFEGSVIVTGKSDMTKYHNYNMSNCDHCKVNRQRKHLVVLEKDATQMVVGTSCLTDFTGHTSAAQYIAMLDWVINLQDTVDNMDMGESSSRGEYVYNMKRVLQTAAAIIREIGYVSASTAEETGKSSTKQNVIACLNGKVSGVDITGADIEKTEAALEWFNTTQHADNDYFYNMSIILSKEYITARYIGYACSLFAVYSKSIQKANAGESNFIGTVGDKKVAIAAVCNRDIAMEGAYGVTHIYMFASGSNVIVYKTSSATFKEGETYNLLATIKDHVVYRGVNQTVITRAKVV